LRFKLSQHILVAYWQYLDIAWPQQVFKKGVDKPRTSQNTIEVKTQFMVEILPPSSLMYANVLQANHSFAKP
jgi:hypothetical protein